MGYPNAYRPGRAPLLKVLVPFVIGLGIAGYYALPWSGMAWALGCLIIALLAWAVRGHQRACLTLLTIALVMTGWWYGNLRLPVVIHDTASPPREAVFTLAVDRVFPSDASHSIRGMGRVVAADQHLSPWESVRIYFNLSRDDEVIVSKSLIQIKGVLTTTGRMEASGFRDYLFRERVSGTMNRGRVISVESSGPVFYQWCARVNRQGMDWLISPGMPHDSTRERSAIIAAMTLGNKSALTPEQKQHFLQTGTMHLFAISGLHVGIIALSMELFLRLIRVPPVARPFIGLAMLYVYVGIIGFSPSAVRAFLMVACYWLALALSRQGRPWPALVLSAWLVLLWNPMQLWNMGFQLSYTVVTGLILYGAILAEWLEKGRIADVDYIPVEQSGLMRQRDWLRRWSLRLLAISFTAMLASLPLTIGYFEVFSPVSVFLNLFLGLMAYGVINGGLMTILSTGLWPGGWLTALLGGFTRSVAGIMQGFVDGIVAIPGMVWYPQYQYTWMTPAATVFTLLAFLVVSRQPATERRYLWLPPMVGLVLLVVGLV